MLLLFAKTKVDSYKSDHSHVNISKVKQTIVIIKTYLFELSDRGVSRCMRKFRQLKARSAPFTFVKEHLIRWLLAV